MRLHLALSKILALVNEMDSVSTEGITPMAHPLNMTQRLRKDEVLEKTKEMSFKKIIPMLMMVIIKYQK